MNSKFSQQQIDNLNLKLAEAVTNFQTLSSPRKLDLVLEAMNSLKATGAFEVKGRFLQTPNAITINISQL
jgi:hypothetical protein